MDEEQNKTENIIISTGDIKGDYEIIGLTNAFFSSVANKGPKTMKDKFNFTVEELKKNAAEMGGDGIIFIHLDYEMIQVGYISGSDIFAYGTVIKFC